MLNHHVSVPDNPLTGVLHACSRLRIFSHAIGEMEKQVSDAFCDCCEHGKHSRLTAITATSEKDCLMTDLPAMDVGHKTSEKPVSVSPTRSVGSPTMRRCGPTTALKGITSWWSGF